MARVGGRVASIRTVIDSRRTSTKVGASTLESSSVNWNHEQGGWRGGVCGKCGAVRVDDQIGLEATPAEYVARLVEVFREVRRVLRSDGTVWLNIGDSYAAARSYQVRDNKHTEVGNNMAMSVPPGLKPKDLIGIPWRLAFALQADGWWLRSEIVWHKLNCMPEAVRDRPTKAHETVFLLTKSPRYFYDADAVAERAEWARWGDQTVPKYEGTDTASGWMKPKSKGELRSGRVGRYADRAMGNGGDGTSPKKTLGEAVGLRNARSVWLISTESYGWRAFRGDGVGAGAQVYSGRYVGVGVLSGVQEAVGAGYYQDAWA